jgi:hypothetical protein
MEAPEARRHDLPMPRQPVPGFRLPGQEVRAGLLRVRIVGLGPTVYDFPCYFIVDPIVPPPSQPRNLLGLTGVVNEIRLGFDGARSIGAPHGSLIVEAP